MHACMSVTAVCMLQLMQRPALEWLPPYTLLCVPAMELRLLDLHRYPYSLIQPVLL